MSPKKADNFSLREKVNLRLEICGQMNTPAKVLDLFAGEGRVWRGVGERMEIESYTPVDEHPRLPGTIKMRIDGRTVNAFDMNRFNVIDIDTYGEPWEVFCAVLPQVKAGSALFLTYGHSGIGRARVTKFLRRECGLPIDWDLPSDSEDRKSSGSDFSRAALPRFLAKYYLRKSLAGRAKQITVIENETVGYYGILLDTAKNG